jgi:hypothetical protein
MMLCRTIVIKFIYLEIFTQAYTANSTGRGGAPTIRRRRRRADAKFSAAAPAKLIGGAVRLARRRPLASSLCAK